MMSESIERDDDDNTVASLKPRVYLKRYKLVGCCLAFFSLLIRGSFPYEHKITVCYCYSRFFFSSNVLCSSLYFFCYVVHWFFLLVPKIQKKFIQLPFLSHNSPNVCLYDDVLVLQNHFEGFLSFFRWCSASEFPTGTLLIEKKKGKKTWKKATQKKNMEKK